MSHLHHGVHIRSKIWQGVEFKLWPNVGQCEHEEVEEDEAEVCRMVSTKYLSVGGFEVQALPKEHSQGKPSACNGQVFCYCQE